jgi:hypothetical protein
VIKKLLMLIVMSVLGVAFVPGGLSTLEDLLGLSGPLVPGALTGGGKSKSKARTASEPGAASPTLIDSEDGSEGSDEPMPVSIDPGSTLGVLTAIQSHAESSGITCSTIESSSRHEDGADPNASADVARWHLAGHGEPTGVVSFLAALEQDGPLSNMERVELSPHDETLLAFSIDLRISRLEEAH